MHTPSVYLQIIGSTTSTSSGNASSAISGAATSIDAILLAVIGALVGMVILIWVGTKVAGSILHMLEGLPFLKLRGIAGLDLHSRANTAILKLLIEAPLVIFGAVLIGHIVQQITGFSIPVTFPNLSSLGH